MRDESLFILFFAFVYSSVVRRAKKKLMKQLSHIHVTLAKQIRLHSDEGWTWEQLVSGRRWFLMMIKCFDSEKLLNLKFEMWKVI